MDGVLAAELVVAGAERVEEPGAPPPPPPPSECSKCTLGCGDESAGGAPLLPELEPRPLAAREVVQPSERVWSEGRLVRAEAELTRRST
jgi:hypothetical protein